MQNEFVRVKELPPEGMDLIQFMKDVELDLILQAMKRTEGNKNQAALLLGLKRTTLCMRLKARGLLPKRPDPMEFFR